MKMQKLLKYAVDSDASDLHISAGFPPTIRLFGELKKINLPVLENDEITKMIKSILTDKQKELLEVKKELDFAYEMKDVARFRCNVFQQMRGLAAAFRVIPTNIKSLADINAPEGAYKLADMSKGLVLVTGPTGSGKSTTLAAMINHVNVEQKKHIITIEDPIEYVHKSISCLINQREIGEHSDSFADALKAALREDPDVILVGEMRDLETISLAVTAAETGHLVLGTLHTSSAPESVDRVIDVFPADQQNQIRSMFSSTLQGVVAQKLIKNAGGKGREAVMEVMIASHAIRNLIRESKNHQINTVIQTSNDVGMQTMDQALMDKLDDGLIEKAVAVHHAHEKKKFEAWQGSSREIFQRANS